MMLGAPSPGLPSTGIAWGDWIILAAAIVVAIGVLWTKIVKPFVRAAQHVSALLDLSEDLPPSVTQTLLGLPAQLAEVHRRIDEHMATEETASTELHDDLNAMREALADRTVAATELNATMQATQDVLTQHIARDDERFVNAQEALVAGQQVLMQQLIDMKDGHT